MAKTNIPIDKAGRLVLPKSVRDHFRLHDGDRLTVEERGETIELRPVRAAITLKKVNGVLVVAADTATPRGVDLVTQSRQQRLNEIAGSESEDHP